MNNTNNNQIQHTQQNDAAAVMEQVLISGNLAKLSEQERVQYYNAVCNSLGLNPLTRPFQYLTLNSKLQLYACKDCTDQLRKLHGVSVHKLDHNRIDSIYVVTAYGRDKSGREDSATGAVNIDGLKGDMLANAVMKAETKAKRRLTLSLCGLGMMDETETEPVPGLRIESPETQSQPVLQDQKKPDPPATKPTPTNVDHVAKLSALRTARGWSDTMVADRLEKRFKVKEIDQLSQDQAKSLLDEIAAKEANQPAKGKVA